MQCRSPSVKQSLAASLHEIARILGEGTLVELELVPVFEDMIQVLPAQHVPLFTGLKRKEMSVFTCFYAFFFTGR